VGPDFVGDGGFVSAAIAGPRLTWKTLSIKEDLMSATHTPPTGHACVIEQVDSQVWRHIVAEADRQRNTLELIASENHTHPAVLAASGTCLTDKYAEGYPGARYYRGCEHYDEIEALARERAIRMFGCRFANVQPHSGASANAAVFMALLEHGDTFASLTLADGGHLSHGMKINFSGKYFNPVHYPLVYDADRPDHERIDYDAVERVCLEHNPRLLLCGYSAYPRVIDFARFRTIADKCGAILMADVSHIAGLIVGGVHPSPFPHAHVVTTTTHKTLRGPRGGLILCDDADLVKAIDRAVFPGLQGGPLMHQIAAKAVCFGLALTEEFKAYAHQIVTNAAVLAKELTNAGYRITSGGTDNHLMLVDLRAKDTDLTGKDASEWLEQAGIIVNMNGIPQDSRPPRITSGIRLGTPAITTRGMTQRHMRQITQMIDQTLTSRGDPQTTGEVARQVQSLCGNFPVPGLA
jgi:glycine hydroxymethyltransferase